MKNRRVIGIAKTCFCMVLSLMLVFQSIPGIVLGQPAGAADGAFTTVSGSFYFGGGATNGYNHFHIEGNETGQPLNSFWQNTFCIEKDHSAATSSVYSYYYNAASVGDPGNAVFVSTALGVNGVDMTAAEWAKFRNCIMYVNVNRDARGQYVLWSGLGHFLPTKYSRAGSFGDTWQDAWLTTYFGAAASADFMGLGPIAAGQTIDIGATADVEISYSASFDPAGSAETTGRIGPFKLQWAAGSSAALAQLNCGSNKNTPPLFNLGASNSSVRFYKDSTTSTPTSSVRLGDEFYIEWNTNAKSGGLTDITVSSIRELITKVIADQFFLNPIAQNQANVDTDTARPEFTFKVKTPAYTGPATPADIEEYVRPTVEKQVAADNHTDNTGSFVDILEVYPGTDVIHEMTVTSEDPKGTVLTFQNTDYDLYPSVLQNYAVDWADNIPSDIALVHDAAAFKAAIDANKNIKLMENITLPSDWTPSATVYSGIFDGNNCKLMGDGGTMTQPVFKETSNAVFYRVQFVDFTMVRDENTATAGNFGALVDLFAGEHSKMLDCYVRGSLAVDVSGSSTQRFVTAGGVAGNANGEIYGVRALLDFTIDCGDSNFFDYSGGLFGQARVSVFENNELLAGSIVTNGNQIFGGLSGCIWASTTELKVLNCKADYTYYNATHYNSDIRERRFGGMFYFTTARITLVDRCIVNCEYYNTPVGLGGGNYGYVNVFSGLIGEYYTNSTTEHMERTVSNCSVNFSEYGDTVIISSVGSETQRGQLGSGSGLVNIGCDGEWKLNTFKIDNCYVFIKMSVENNAGAGIFNDVRKTTGSPYSIPEPYILEISNCIVEGQIIGSGDSIIAGIATDSSVKSSLTAAEKAIGLQSGSITNCIVTAELSADAGRIGGIWATRVHNTYRSVPLTSHGDTMYITNCLFDGTIDDGGVADAHDIFACYDNTLHACATAANNYTTHNSSATDATAPDGAYYSGITHTDSDLSWYKNTLLLDIALGTADKTGADSPIWALDGGSPTIATAYSWPVQRIYVTDYYHQNNSQEFIENLYVWEDGQFKHLWESQYLSKFYSSTGDYNRTGDAADHYVDLYMQPGTNTITFYYFVGDTATPTNAGGGNGPWNGVDGLTDSDTGHLLWQNTVKITPRDNKIVDDGTGGKKFDWQGAYDDDWVLCIEDEPEIRLNIIKMSDTSGFPVPLEGSIFTLYSTNAAFGGPVTAGTLSPSGFNGVTNPPILTEGNYVLTETTAPANYTANAGRSWYLIFADGVLEMYSDSSLAAASKIALGEEHSDNTLTYTAILDNARDSSAPLAKISLIKCDENGNPIPGELTDGGLRFTGAIYELYKFEDDGFTGYSHNYGNPLAFGAGMQDWCLIEPGYYEMLEIKAPDDFVINTTPIYIFFDGTSLIINGDKAATNQSTIYSQGTTDKVYVTVEELLATEATIKARDAKMPVIPPDDPTTTPYEPTTPDDPTTPPDDPTVPPTVPTAPTTAPTTPTEPPTTPTAPPEPPTTPVTPPDEPTPPTPPVFPPPPVVPPGNTLVDDGDSFIEFDEDGVPLGRWVLDDDDWVFVPLAEPETGDSANIIGLAFIMLCSLAVLFGLLYSRYSRYNKKRHNSM